MTEARLKELLNSGASLDQLLAAMVPESRMDNLRSLALLRRFDRQAMSEALSLKGTNQEDELKSLLEDNQVIESAEEPGIFAVACTHRQSARGWWNIVVDPVDGTWLGKSEDDQQRNKECHEIHERMVAYFSRAEGGNWLYEHLHHLCAVKPGEAMALLVEELATCLPQPEPDGDDAVPSSHPDARDGIALGRATDLLRVVEEQTGYLPAAEKDIYLAQSSLVETWTAVCREWFRSRRYIRRPNVHQWFEEMRNPEGKPFLFLHAAGGSGKTMSLRWLITHHCVPRGEPVAHLDFDDFVDTGPIKGWQLLLRCAEQLDRQLPTRPLSTLIKDIVPFEQALRDRSRTPITRGESMTEQGQPDDVLLKFPAKFGRHLQRINDRIITIIIDTLEVPMLRDDVTDVTEFIAMLVRFAMVARNVRIILCGRYQLADMKLEDELRNDGEIWNFYD